MVEAQAGIMAQAVMDGQKGQLATVKYLLEAASIYPPSTDGSHATADEGCLAKTLLQRLNIPDEPDQVRRRGRTGEKGKTSPRA